MKSLFSRLPLMIASAVAVCAVNSFAEENRLSGISPSGMPGTAPSGLPGTAPSGLPGTVPSGMPSMVVPSGMPSMVPSGMPSMVPSGMPSMVPSGMPSMVPSGMPSMVPSGMPSMVPSGMPSMVPSGMPSMVPSGMPSMAPSGMPASTTSVVQTKTSPLGTSLSDGQGKTLYLFSSDTSGSSNCGSVCTQVWKPYLVKTGQTPTVAGEANQNLVGTIARSDGATQATYNGWPLYSFVGDVSTDDMKGNKVSSFGGTFFPIKPDGTELKS